MGFLGFGKIRVTPQKLARELHTNYSNILKTERLEAKAHSREKWLQNEEWDYDMHSHVDEHEALYAFITFYFLPKYFGEKGVQTRQAFLPLLQSHNASMISKRIPKYKEVWENTEKLGEQGNPIKALAEKCVSLRFGDEDNWKLFNVIMMTSSISGFIAGLKNASEKIKIV